MPGNWIRTWRGSHFTPTSPNIEDLDVRDFAHSLSLLNRYTGHTDKGYSVGQHSCHVADYLFGTKQPRLIVFCGLMHDVPEAYVNDLNRPVKHGPGLEAYRAIEDRIWAQVAIKFGLPDPIPPVVKAADSLIAEFEMASLNDNWPKPTRQRSPWEPLQIITPWPAGWAEYEFLRRFRELTT